MKDKYKFIIFGIISGCINGAFGSGGGLIVVPMLENIHLQAKKAHATSVAIIFFLSIITQIFYVAIYKFNIFYSLYFLPSGIIGSIFGSLILKKISTKFLKKIFAIYIIFSSIRLFLR